MRPVVSGFADWICAEHAAVKFRTGRPATQPPTEGTTCCIAVCVALFWLSTSGFLRAADEGVFVRFRMLQPEKAQYYVKLGGFVHVANWYLPDKTIPPNADKKKDARVPSGEFTEWVDLKAQFGKSLHLRMNRAGGVAELPNITARFFAEPESLRREVEVELATAADPAKVVKRWHESFAENLMSFLVSPNLATDAAQLESGAELGAGGYGREAACAEAVGAANRFLGPAITRAESQGSQSTVAAWF